MRAAHDPLCLSVKHPGPHGLCDCGTIRIVRADERERIAQAIEAERDLYERLDYEVQIFSDAARIARNGGRDA